jgi:hypothetical protein
MHAAAGEGERKMAMPEIEMTADQEYIWLLRGQDLALEALKDFPKPYSHMELDLLRIGRETIEQAVDSVIHSEELAGREPKCRQLISEGAYLAYSEWATQEMVFSEGATSE